MDAESGCGPAAATSVRGRVVVGYDIDSPRSLGVLRWSAAEAVARDALLKVVCSSAESRQRVAFAGAVSATREDWPSVSIEQVSSHIDAPDALLAEAVGADLLVVSELSTGAAQRRLSDSIPLLVAQRSLCPVVVVRDGRRHSISRIAVGVDSSNASATALDWAIAEAALHHADIVVVHAWEQRSHRGSMRANDLDRADARCVVDLAVRHCKKHLAVPVSGVVIEGGPALALVTAGQGADLIVVGSRGRSGFKTLLFGSVALFVAEHAPCPVAVTHPRLRDSSL